MPCPLIKISAQMFNLLSFLLHYYQTNAAEVRVEDLESYVTLSSSDPRSLTCSSMSFSFIFFSSLSSLFPFSPFSSFILFFSHFLLNLIIHYSDCLYYETSYRPCHTTLHHITPYPITLHRITSYHIISHRIISHHITSHHIP